MSDKPKGICAQPACRCKTPEGKKYCSQYCEDAAGTMEISCNCDRRVLAQRSNIDNHRVQLRIRKSPDFLHSPIRDAISDYSRERLIAAVRKHATLSTAELFTQLFAEIRQFTNSTLFSDDVCLLGMEVTRPWQSVSA